MATRRERVILELQDDFTSGMAKAAAATALLDKELNGLSGTSVETTKGVGDTNREVEKSSPIFTQASKDIDRYSGRLRLLTEAAVTLGPALVPIGAVAVPAVVALAGGLAAAAAGAGVALLAFNGVGDALKALDAYQLDPTTAHLEKMRQEFEKIGPTGVEFVKFLDDLEPELKSLQEVARAGLFPGVEAGITSLLTMFPQLRTIVFSLSTELGGLAKEAGGALSGDMFSAFFDYLETDAAPTLTAFAHTLGNVAAGLASLLVDFAPLSRDFSSGMEAMSKSFANWAATLSKTDGFRSFVAYVRESGPQVLDLLGSLATAFIDIAQAAAPVGALVVPALTALANVLGAIASSPIGGPLFTAAAAMIAISRAAKLASGALDKIGVSSARTGTALTRIAGTAAGIAAVGIAVGAMADGIGRINAADLDRSLTALSQGNVTDEIDKVVGSLSELTSKWNSIDLGEVVTAGGLFGDSTLDKDADNIDQVDQKLAQLVETGQSALASKMFQNITALADAQGVSAETTADHFDAYALALKNAGAPSDAAATAARKVAQAHNRQAESADHAAASTASLVDAMQAETEAALGAFDAETQYRQALKDAQAQAKKNEAGIRDSSKASLENRSALSGLASAWNGQSNAVKNNVGRWKEARRAFLDVADGMNIPIAKAKALADRMMQIPTSIVIKQQNNMDPAIQTAKLLKAAVENIPRTWLTEYTINTIRTGTKPELHAPAGSAGGGFVPKTGLPYADRHPYLLADGEGVTTNRRGETDRFRDVIGGINAGFSRSQVKGMLADGGFAGGSRSLDNQLEIAQILQQLRDMRQQLAERVKKGDNKGELVTRGGERRLLQLQLLVAERDLRRAKHAEEREAAQAAREKAKKLYEKAQDTRHEVTSISRGFDLTATMDASDVSDAFKALRDSVKDAGGDLPRNFKALRSEAIDLARSLTKTTKEYEDTTKALEDMRATATDFAKGVGNIFNNDIYAKGGAANALLQLQADTNDTNSRNSLLQQIAAGIDPTSDAFKSLASSADMQTLQDLASNLADLKAFEASFAERATTQQTAGAWAAQVAYQPAIDAMVNSAADQKAIMTDLAAKLEAIQEKAATGVLWSTWTGTAAGAQAGVIAGFAGQKKKTNSKARTR